MAIIIHDHGDPSPVIAAVSPDVQAFAARVQPMLPIAIPPPPPAIVKDADAVQDAPLADVVERKKKT